MILIAVDVHVSLRMQGLLQAHGIKVVVRAEHAEPDQAWFARAVAAGAQAVISSDWDLARLCNEANIAWVKLPTHGKTGTANLAHRVRKAIVEGRAGLRPRRS
jgi:hypothetical protein